MSKMLSRTAVLGLALLAAGTLSIAQSGGEATYKAKCQMCHGATGAADTPAGRLVNAKAFSDPILAKRSDASILTVLNSGDGKMPSFKDKLTESQLQELVVYIRQLQKKK
jgi:mono/diheme cytochrome c family protein